MKTFFLTIGWVACLLISCSKNEDACERTVCKNGGQKLYNGTVCKCDCPAGFTGSDCSAYELQAYVGTWTTSLANYGSGWNMTNFSCNCTGIFNAAEPMKLTLEIAILTNCPLGNSGDTVQIHMNRLPEGSWPEMDIDAQVLSNGRSITDGYASISDGTTWLINISSGSPQFPTTTDIQLHK